MQSISIQLHQTAKKKKEKEKKEKKKTNRHLKKNKKKTIGLQKNQLVRIDWKLMQF